jgi:CP family cyanate transporter-like MFS transporter
MALAVNSLIAYTMFTWLPRLLRDAGVSEQAAGLYLAAFGAGTLPGTLITPLLVTRLRRTWILPVAFFAAYAVALTGLMAWPARATLVWILVSRIGDSYFPYCFTMINLRTRSARGSIALSGFVQPAAYALAVVGPWGFGALHSLAGNWQVPMYALLGLLPVLLAGGLITARAHPIDV